MCEGSALRSQAPRLQERIFILETFFYDLCVFFGIADIPASFSDLIPWLCQVFLAVVIVMFIFKMVGTVMTEIIRSLRIR